MRQPLPEPTFDAPLAACRLCGSTSVRAFDRDCLGRRIDRCERCAVMFLNPQYSDAHLAAFYGAYIPEASETEGDAERAAKAPVHHYHLELIEQAGPKGRLLSVGCGSGVELEVARARGWDVEGYDVDPPTVARVRERLGVPVRTGDFLALDWPRGAYQCVYLHHVLEHPKNPDAYLARIRELLAPGGRLFIACPNLGSVSNRFKTFAGKLGLKAKRGRHYDTWHHLFYFSPGVLGRLLEEHYGLEVVATANGLKGLDRDPRSIRVRARVNRLLPCYSSIFVLVARKPS